MFAKQPHCGVTRNKKVSLFYKVLLWNCGLFDKIFLGIEHGTGKQHGPAHVGSRQKAKTRFISLYSLLPPAERIIFLNDTLSHTDKTHFWENVCSSPLFIIVYGFFSTASELIAVAVWNTHFPLLRTKNWYPEIETQNDSSLRFGSRAKRGTFVAAHVKLFARNSEITPKMQSKNERYATRKRVLQHCVKPVLVQMEMVSDQVQLEDGDCQGL